MENEKIKSVMLWLNVIKGYADFILDDDLTIAINTKGILAAVSTNTGKSVYIPINTVIQDVDTRNIDIINKMVTVIVNEFKK